MDAKNFISKPSSYDLSLFEVMNHWKNLLLIIQNWKYFLDKDCIINLSKRWTRRNIGRFSKTSKKQFPNGEIFWGAKSETGNSCRFYFLGGVRIKWSLVENKFSKRKKERYLYKGSLLRSFRWKWSSLSSR